MLEVPRCVWLQRNHYLQELMLDPTLVARILYDMSRRLSSTDLSVKCRIGVSGRDSYDELVEFVRAIEV